VEYELNPASMQDLPVARNLSMFYIYDMAEFMDWPCQESGLFEGCEEFFADWQAGRNHPYLIRCQGELAGFAGVKATKEGHCIQEFFILRKFRRHGLGRQVAEALFQAFPGAWKIQALAANTPAVAFWRAVVRDYAQGQFSEHDGEDSPWGYMHTICFGAAP
jgi:predicted acetyltransferase